MEPRIIKLTISLPEEIDTEIRVQAARKRTTISAIALEAFEEYLAKIELELKSQREVAA